MAPAMESKKIAEYVLSFSSHKGDLLTNKKLQKLLYYVEAWSLVYLHSIVKEDFEAWIHGPVLPDVYKTYKKFGANPITVPFEKTDALNKKLDLSKNQIKLIEAVLLKYGGLSSFQLEQLSHSELPWKEARKDCKPFDKCDRAIKKSTMKRYYSSLVNG